MKLIFLLFLLMLSLPAQAAVCVENNTVNCNALGYTESSCPYGGVACPFDVSLWYCATWSCEDGRYSSDSSMDCEEGERVRAVNYKDLTCYYCAPTVSSGDVLEGVIIN